MTRKRRTAHRFGDKRRTGDVLTEEKVDFSGLMLSSCVLEGLKSAGFERPSPIQLKAIPLGRCGLDLIAQAKSGTGKTCVFSVIALENINLSVTSIQVLVLAPTREIAVQIKDVVCSIGRHMKGLHVQVFIGGMPVEEDKQRLNQCHIAIGTPGRLKHLIENKSLKTDSIRLFILDEADKLLDDSFQSQTNWIYSTLPVSKQVLALSATYTNQLAEHLKNYMNGPTFVRLNATDPSLEGIRHYRSIVPFHSFPHKVFQYKMNSLLDILSKLPFHQCLIFSNYQIRARNLSETLEKNGWPSTYISGSQGQSERLKAMDKLKEFKCRILISTDLTSRGIDAERVNLVINMDVPRDSETYLHRVGRAGRFGSYGAAINFVADGKEITSLNDVEAGCGLVIDPLPDDISQLLSEPHFDRKMNGATPKPNGENLVGETPSKSSEQSQLGTEIEAQRKDEEDQMVNKGLAGEREGKKGILEGKMDDKGKNDTVEHIDNLVTLEVGKEHDGIELGFKGKHVDRNLGIGYIGNVEHGINMEYDANHRAIDKATGSVHQGDDLACVWEHGVTDVGRTVDCNERVVFQEKTMVGEQLRNSPDDVGMFGGNLCNMGSTEDHGDSSRDWYGRKNCFEEKPANERFQQCPEDVGILQDNIGNMGSNRNHEDNSHNWNDEKEFFQEKCAKLSENADNREILESDSTFRECVQSEINGKATGDSIVSQKSSRENLEEHCNKLHNGNDGEGYSEKHSDTEGYVRRKNVNDEHLEGHGGISVDGSVPKGVCKDHRGILVDETVSAGTFEDKEYHQGIYDNGLRVNADNRKTKVSGDSTRPISISSQTSHLNKISDSCAQPRTNLQYDFEGISTEYMTSAKIQKNQLIFCRGPPDNNPAFDIPPISVLECNSKSTGSQESSSENSDCEESYSENSRSGECVSKNSSSNEAGSGHSVSEESGSGNSYAECGNSCSGNSGSGNSGSGKVSSKRTTCEGPGTENSSFEEPVSKNSDCDDPDSENSSSDEISSRGSSFGESNSENLVGRPDVPVCKKDFDVALETFIEENMSRDSQNVDCLCEPATSEALRPTQSGVDKPCVRDDKNPARCAELGESSHDSESGAFYSASRNDVSEYLCSIPSEWKNMWYKEYKRQTNLISTYTRFYCDTM